MVWINILSMILAPVIAVWVGQKLQDHAEKRKDKMWSAIIKVESENSPKYGRIGRHRKVDKSSPIDL